MGTPKIGPENEPIWMYAVTYSDLPHTRPSRWQLLRWRLRALWRRMVALFRWRGWWWAEEDE